MADTPYEVLTQKTDENRLHRYTIAHRGAALTHADVWRLWQHDKSFRALFCSQLSASPFSAYRWETPPVTTASCVRPFEFVLLNTPYVARGADTKTFADYFEPDDDTEGIVTFNNLGGDALLIVPSPRGPATYYSDLATFMRSAPAAQIDALWRVAGETMRQRVGDRPLWLSTAGGGVAWLHLRIDTRPKYYGHAPYKRIT